MTTPSLIASYGGSGSTFLTHALRDRPGAGGFVHTHAVPESDFLGVPLITPVTGHAEGPFSRAYELPRDARVVLIHRDPAEAYLSRAGFKHFMHLWAGTDRVAEVFGDAPVNTETFNRLWREHVEAERDIMGFAEYIARWDRYARAGRHHIAFVRYEALDAAWPDLLDFLGADPGPLEGFAARARNVPAREAAIFGPLRAALAARPPIEIFPATDTDSDPAPRRADPDRPAALDGATFAVTGLAAGAGDSLSRVAVTYNLAKALTDAAFLRPGYSNYHAPETDFMALFGVEATAERDAPAAGGTVAMPTSRFLFEALHDPDALPRGGHYLLEADLYPNDPRLQFARQFRAVPDRFHPQLRYVPRTDPFTGAPDDAQRVVVHMRRQDIVLGAFDALREAEPSRFPEALFHGLHRRDLLDLDRAVSVLETRLDPARPVAMVIASDGVARVRARMRDHPALLDRLDAVEAELLAEPRSDRLGITVTGRLIGTDPELTRQVLDAMYRADMVLTAASSFPNLVCFLGGTRLVPVQAPAAR